MDFSHLDRGDSPFWMKKVWRIFEFGKGVLFYILFCFIIAQKNIQQHADDSKLYGRRMPKTRPIWHRYRWILSSPLDGSSLSLPCANILLAMQNYHQAAESTLLWAMYTTTSMPKIYFKYLISSVRTKFIIAPAFSSVGFHVISASAERRLTYLNCSLENVSFWLIYTSFTDWTKSSYPRNIPLSNFCCDVNTGAFFSTGSVFEKSICGKYFEFFLQREINNIAKSVSALRAFCTGICCYHWKIIRRVKEHLLVLNNWQYLDDWEERQSQPLDRWAERQKVNNNVHPNVYMALW